MWSQWALPQAQVGSRILEILEDLTGSAALDQHATDLISLPGVLWLGRTDLSPTVQRRRAA